MSGLAFGNARIWTLKWDSILPASRERWEREIQINHWGMFNCSRAVLERMIARKSGVVVSMGSDAGHIGEYREGVYTACKAGVTALTKTFAREYGKQGAQFNVVCPGTTTPESDDQISTLRDWCFSGQCPNRRFVNRLGAATSDARSDCGGDAHGLSVH